MTVQKRMGSVNQAAEDYPAFTKGGIRNWIFTNQDGFKSQCVIRVGSKILLDYDAIDQWLEAHRESA